MPAVDEGEGQRQKHIFFSSPTNRIFNFELYVPWPEQRNRKRRTIVESNRCLVLQSYRQFFFAALALAGDKDARALIFALLLLSRFSNEFEKVSRRPSMKIRLGMAIWWINLINKFSTFGFSFWSLNEKRTQSFSMKKRWKKNYGDKKFNYKNIFLSPPPRHRVRCVQNSISICLVVP